VLLPPSSLGEPAVARRAFPVRLTRRQVEDSPELEAAAPAVARRHETELYRHYGWEPYWVATDGLAPPVAPHLKTAGGEPGQAADRAEGDPHLRAARAVIDHHVHATDGDIGHVEDFLVDSAEWTIRYMVVGTTNWWPGKKVLIAPPWLAGVDWADGTARVNLTREAIRRSTEYDPTATVDRAYEERLHRHFHSGY
jgi:hypothetical protein